MEYGNMRKASEREHQDPASTVLGFLRRAYGIKLLKKSFCLPPKTLFFKHFCTPDRGCWSAVTWVFACNQLPGMSRDCFNHLEVSQLGKPASVPPGSPPQVLACCCCCCCCCCCWERRGYSWHSWLLREAVLLHLTWTSTSGMCCSVVLLKCKRSPARSFAPLPLLTPRQASLVAAPDCARFCKFLYNFL